MSVIQVFLEVSPDITYGLITGKLVRIGGVVRDSASGAIITHLKEVKASQVDQTVDQLSLIDKVVKNKTKAIAITAGLALIAGTVIFFFVRNKNKRNQVSEIPENVIEFNDALSAYIDVSRIGKLDLDIVNRLIAASRSVENDSRDSKIQIDFSIGDLKVLIHNIYEFTVRLAEANSFIIDSTKDDNELEEGILQNLIQNLEIQKSIFEKAMS